MRLCATSESEAALKATPATCTKVVPTPGYVCGASAYQLLVAVIVSLRSGINIVDRTEINKR